MLCKAVKCLKDCIDGQAVRYDRERIYNIDPTNPCAIYFELPKEGRIIALQTEKERRLKTLENQRALGYKDEFLSRANPNEFDAELKSLGVKIDDNEFMCTFDGCEFIAKNAFGLQSHMRSHN